MYIFNIFENKIVIYININKLTRLGVCVQNEILKNF
jgi:hypothetical protein